MPPEQTAPRTRPDLCPGVLALHQAADGGLARIRLPGGVLTAAQLRLLAQLATDLGDGAMELTSRANLQLRGLGPDAAPILSQALYDAGLLPSITHERVRNIIASPLSGLDPLSTYDVLPVAAELDRLLCADPALAELPGRFLFTLDDGRGDLGTIHSDLGVRAVDKTTAELLLAGTETGVRIPWADVPAVLVAAADAFLAERTARASTAWRLAELPDGVDAILASIPLTGVHSSHFVVPVDNRSGARRQSGDRVVHRNHEMRRMNAQGGGGVGVHRQSDGAAAVVAVVPLGRLMPNQAAVVAELANSSAGSLRITPWRSVVVPDLLADPRERLDAAGLLTDARSAWIGMTACAGRPGCARALADVRADATRALAVLPAGRAVHWSGCERRCGRPDGAIDVVATGNGYEVDGSAAPDVAAAVAARRTQ